MVQTFHASPAKGTGLRGIDLDRCYTGGYDDAGRRHGHGRYDFPNHMCYVGEYVKGQKHGAGRLTFPDGGYYEGDFEQDEINGKGSRRFANGSVFTGTFRMGEMHGSGRLVRPNGDTYDGAFESNAMEGDGRMTFTNGDVYNGRFSKNRINGRGSMAYACGDAYKGEWVDCKRSGRGACDYANGDRYEGEWADGTPHGQGVLTVVRADLTYDGAFVCGRPSQVPTKLNLLMQLGVQAAAAPAAKKGAKPSDPAAPPVLPLVLGTPMGAGAGGLMVVRAQLSVALSAEEVAAAAAAAVPPAKGAPPPPTPPPDAETKTEAPPAGSKWVTSEMESGRALCVTLHAEPPAPLEDGRELGCVIAMVEGKDGTARLRLLLLPASLSRPLAMRTNGDGEAVNGVEVELANGMATLEGLVIGSGDAAADAESLSTPSGTGALVASSYLLALAPGYARVALPEAKVAKK